MYKSKELSIFYEKLGQLCSAGIPIVEGILLASEQLSSSELRRDAKKMVDYLRQGLTVTQAAKGVWMFSEAELALIAVGEMRGRLDESFLQMARLRERGYINRKKFAGALLYPVLLLVAAIFIPPLVMLFTSGLAAYVAEVSRVVTGIMILVAAAYFVYLLTRAALGDDFDRLILLIPVLGKHLRALALARFCRSLSVLFSAGVDLPSCIKVARVALANRYLQNSTAVIQEGLDKGLVLSEAFAASGIFPRELLEMVATGERTGELDRMLDKAASYYEFEVEQAVKAALVVIPLVLYLAVAIYIAYLVISFYAGYFEKLGTSIK
ncbi:MAG: type II secretion system F family protein [Acidobacteriota bacterium]|nr:type II secretion system F family protein [Blastocatellia bacterium]MDW8411663.1 type II secretion system F family protein [Acidobacteriota bacterium]